MASSTLLVFMVVAHFMFFLSTLMLDMIYVYSCESRPRVIRGFELSLSLSFFFLAFFVCHVVIFHCPSQYYAQENLVCFPQ